MNEHLFLKGQRVISEKAEGEVVDAIGNEIIVKLDSGRRCLFSLLTCSIIMTQVDVFNDT